MPTAFYGHNCRIPLLLFIRQIEIMLGLSQAKCIETSTSSVLTNIYIVLACSYYEQNIISLFKIMKPIFKYLFALCILFLIGNKLLAAYTTTQSAFPFLVESQKNQENSDSEIFGLEQNFNTKSLPPTIVEIPRVAVSEFEAKKKHTTYLSYGPYLVVHFKPLTSLGFIHNNGLIPNFAKHLSFSSSRRHLLFEVFRI